MIRQFFAIVDFAKAPFIYFEFILGLGLLLYLALFAHSSAQKKQKRKEISVKPIALFMLGASGTVFDLPTAIPYLAVLGKMSAMNLDFVSIVMLLVFYCLIYLLPMILIYVAYVILGKKVEPLLKEAKIGIDRFSKRIAIFFGYAIALFLIVDSIFSMTGHPIAF